VFKPSDHEKIINFSKEVKPKINLLTQVLSEQVGKALSTGWHKEEMTEMPGLLTKYVRQLNEV